MRYIERILQPGERLLYSGTIHWVIYVPTMILLLLAIAALYPLSQVKAEATFYSWTIVAAAFLAAALVTFASAWYRRWTTEIDVTDRRVVYKSGFVRRHTVEMNMDKIESGDVDQSIMGRMLDFGDITVRGTGETLETFHRIGDPLEFRNKVTAR